MIINKIDNYYIIKLPNTKIDIFDLDELEKIVQKIILKVNRKYNVNNCIHLELYLNDNYGIIIKLTDYKLPFIINNEKNVKITIHADTPFLYQIDYFDIEKRDEIKNIYYYKNKFYLELKDNINKIEYLKLLELSEIIYEDSLDIIDKGIKI